MSDFLPKGYDENENLNAKSGGYMKFEQGENKFRVLDSAIVGWEWWETTSEGGRKPSRVRLDEKIDISTLEDPDSIKRFWAMPVWNYKAKAVQILEITQKGIQKKVKAFVRSKDWGKPQGYDLSVFRTGEGLQTEYEVVPAPPKAVNKEIKEAYEKTTINLEALFDGEDPFEILVPDDL